MIDARGITANRTLKAEVCVIGSGAGGAVAATALATRGFDVILLEEGDHHPAATMTQDEHTMIPRLFQDAGQRSTRDQSVMIMQGRALGGGTAHNTGLCVPIPEALWESWRAVGAAPCDYAAFRPFLDRVMETIRARRADEDEINANNRLLRRGAEARGLSYFVAHHNRIKCSGCGYCTLGCAYNRKMSVVHAWLPDGERAGLRIVVNARVRGLGGVAGARTVEVQSPGGVRFAVHAPIVVVAAGAVASPLLLRAAGWADKKNCGRTLRLHPFAPVGAVFAERIDAARGVPQTILVDHHADFMKGGEGGFILMVAAAQPAIAAVMTPGTGAAHRAIMTRYPHLAAAGVLAHDRTAGTVAARRDGAPLIDYFPNRADLAEIRRGIRLLAEMYFDLGAERVILPLNSLPLLDSRDGLKRFDLMPLRPHDLTLGSVHPQGTCPMGDSRSTATVDRTGEVFGARGVFVADASLFPTSVGVPPQVTTMALAAAVADGIAVRRAELSR